MPEAANKGEVPYEQFLSSLPDKEREAFLGHQFSCCTLSGQLLQLPSQQENLFDTVSRMERYVVDTNSSWKAESAKLENRDKAFIISKTVTDEQDNVLGLLFKNVDVSNNNLFLVGMFTADWTHGEPTILIDRIDRYYRGILDEKALATSARPKAEKMLKDAVFKKHQAELTAGVEHEKHVMLLLLGKLNDISELGPPDELKQKRLEFRSVIHREAAQCSLDWYRSVHVARHCYALLLMEKIPIRREFTTPNYVNVFGDTRIIQMALFLQARILSNDKGVKRMASYADLECVPKP